MNAAMLKVQRREIVELPIAQIKMDGVANIREFYQPESLNDLSASVSEIGVMGPVIVSREKDGAYELVIGSRRIKASLRAGKETIPAIVLEGLDAKTKLVMALSENIHHEDLTPFEEARTMLKLLNEHSMNMKELSLTIGRPENTIRNRIKLLKLPAPVQDLVSQQLIKVNTVNVLESLKSPEDQERFAKITVDHCLNAQELSALVEREAEKKARKPKPKDPITYKRAQLKIRVLTNTLRRLMLNVARMNKKEQAIVKHALNQLKVEVENWIEKTSDETK